MAKATAECRCVTCGRTFRKTKDCFKRSEADQWEIWAAEHYTECDECSKARQQAEREAATAAEAEALPALTGSEKQISWALSIRSKFLDDVNYMTAGELSGEGKAFMAWLISSRTESRWWIDHRSTPAEEIIDEQFAEYSAQ